MSASGSYAMLELLRVARVVAVDLVRERLGLNARSAGGDRGGDRRPCGARGTRPCASPTPRRRERDRVEDCGTPSARAGGRARRRERPATGCGRGTCTDRVFDTIAKRTPSIVSPVSSSTCDLGARSLAAEERLERGDDVERMRHVPLQLAVTLDAPDHRGVEADAGVEEERPAVGRPDADALRRAPRQRRDNDVRRVDRVVGIAERARVHVRRTAGQRRERGRAVQQAVGRLVERAVAREHRDDIEAVVRGRAREARGVAAPRRLRDLDVVVGGEQFADQDALAGP